MKKSHRFVTQSQPLSVSSRSYSGHVTNYVNAYHFTDHSLIRLTTFHSVIIYGPCRLDRGGYLPFPLRSPYIQLQFSYHRCHFSQKVFNRDVDILIIMCTTGMKIKKISKYDPLQGLTLAITLSRLGVVWFSEQ